MRPLFLAVIITFFVQPFARSAPSPESNPTVFIDPLKQTQLFERLTYPAKVQPRVEANILSEVDGVIEKIHAPLGKKVEKNQLLVTLRHTDPVYQYAPVHIRSAVAGVVSQIELTEGSRVTRGQKLMAVIDPKLPKVVIELAAADLEDIKMGMTGDLKPVGQEKAVEVKVIGISPFIDSATGTATCELEVVQGTEKVNLPPGLMGKVSFRVRERKGFQVPESAVIFRGKETFVRIVNDNTVQLTAVKLGNLHRGFYEITDGIKEGQNIVIRSSQYVANGQKVQVQTEESAKFE